MTKSSLWENGLVPCYSYRPHHRVKAGKELKAGTRRQELRHWLWRRAAYWLAPLLLTPSPQLAQLAFLDPGVCFHGRHHCQQTGPFLIHQENAPQTFSQLRLSHMTLACVKLINKQTKQNKNTTNSEDYAEKPCLKKNKQTLKTQKTDKQTNKQRQTNTKNP